MDQKLDQRRDQLDVLEIQETVLQEENTAQLVQLAILIDDVDNIIRQAKVHEAEIMNAASDEVHDLLLELEQSRQHAHTLENERSAQTHAEKTRMKTPLTEEFYSKPSIISSNNTVASLFRKRSSRWMTWSVRQ
ncbi:hypothetical protein M409DRAFT_23740 [Zasmidium cellare ATCC 36951]|uniref:Uncharacterized protein n=1 Tax=Zasmidium cellare ATCC 36951 TaxID=1080233 RepID=A0A6A6CJ88_ZASCE|nr:uncharacterized protein M409DRAFT_23740 [Zasmidium cellare ATCC 36951]KAF2166012.1 hypothetical protein M409DRAFT_23740 [Zasmidium cellare ATCC 36951]